MDKIKIAIVGMGNCASSLIQGIYYYADKTETDDRWPNALDYRMI